MRSVESIAPYSVNFSRFVWHKAYPSIEGTEGVPLPLTGFQKAQAGNSLEALIRLPVSPYTNTGYTAPGAPSRATAEDPFTSFAAACTAHSFDSKFPHHTPRASTANKCKSVEVSTPHLRPVLWTAGTLIGKPEGSAVRSLSSIPPGKHRLPKEEKARQAAKEEAARMRKKRDEASSASAYSTQ